MHGKTKNIKIVVACTKDIRIAVKFSSENNLIYRIILTNLSLKIFSSQVLNKSVTVIKTRRTFQSKAKLSFKQKILA